MLVLLGVQWVNCRLLGGRLPLQFVQEFCVFWAEQDEQLEPFHLVDFHGIWNKVSSLGLAISNIQQQHTGVVKVSR